MSRPDPELRAVRAVTRRLAVATAAAITVLLVVVGIVAAGVVWREQGAEARRALRRAVVDLDDLRNTPAGTAVWLREPGGAVRTSPDAPGWLPVRRGVAAVTPADPRDERRVRHGGQDYRVYTIRSNGVVAQSVASTRPEQRERSRLLTGLAVAELAGLAMSVLLGTVLARRATAPLLTSMRRQRRFVADASHELRTPLTLLSTRAQLLERSLRRSAPEAHEESAALVADTRRLAEVVDDLLLSASLSDQPARREQVDLAELARAAVAAAQAHASAQGVALRLAADEPVSVHGVPGPLRRVVDALLDNALSHTPPGGCVEVRVEAGPPATVAVVDNGPGIDPSVAPHLFDRFAHGSATGGRRHFGLGLALVREVVEAHGGSIDAGATPGGGATFTVTLPAGRQRHGGPA